ncbi:hypothetical protein MKZ38_001319 [Zalerion maritima]|uniref:Uncharacterized protein n=1 Tax=Zalerion maritima TaxID=339359 RepID=A0AAD5WTW8_9PEZI|nr:hypothetical protein MKZ38_001319 [Zalerion maritima]
MADFTNSRNRYPARRALFDALQAACLRQTSLLRIPGGGWTTLCDVAAEGWENEGHVKFQVRPLRAPGRDIFSHGGAALPDCNFAALSNSGSPARDSSTGSGGRGSRGENREAGTYRICPARLFTERSSAVSGTMCSRLGDVITWNGGEWRLLLCRPASLEEGRPIGSLRDQLRTSVLWIWGILERYAEDGF